jgi:signal transduction histidine kinase
VFTKGYSTMKTLFKSIVIMLAALAFCGGVLAADKGTADEAVAMVKKGVAFVKANGKEKAFAEFSNPKGQFVDRDLYVMVYDMEGNNKAHGSNPKLIGKNLLEIKDADGKFIVKGLIEVAQKGKGWFDYKWPNATTKAVEPKSTYVEKVDDILIGVGIYK